MASALCTIMNRVKRHMLEIQYLGKLLASQVFSSSRLFEHSQQHQDPVFVFSLHLLCPEQFSVSNLSASATSWDRVLVRWSPAGDPGAGSYRLSYNYIQYSYMDRSPRSASSSATVTVSGNTTSVVVPVDLRKGHVYVSVQPVSPLGSLGEVVTVKPSRQGRLKWGDLELLYTVHLFSSRQTPSRQTRQRWVIVVVRTRLIMDWHEQRKKWLSRFDLPVPQADISCVSGLSFSF